MTDPIFLTRDEMKKRQRLTDLKSDSDAECIFDDAVLWARTWMYRNVEATQITSLLATPSSATPSTPAEITRMVAQGLEVKLVRRQLLCTLPVLFMDDSGEAKQIWNEEAPFRSFGPSQVERLIQKLDDEIAVDIELVSGEDQFGSEVKLNATTVSRPTSCPAPRPGFTLWKNQQGYS